MLDIPFATEREMHVREVQNTVWNPQLQTDENFCCQPEMRGSRVSRQKGCYEFDAVGGVLKRLPEEVCRFTRGAEARERQTWDQAERSRLDVEREVAGEDVENAEWCSDG